MKQLSLGRFDHRTDLPQWITSRIGQIVVEWSVLERELEELIQMLINTDIGFSHIITNRMNARTRIVSLFIRAPIFSNSLRKEASIRL
jgi:hypothetical protein